MRNDRQDTGRVSLESGGNARQIAGLKGGLSVALIVLGFLVTWLWQDVNTLQAKTDAALSVPNPATSVHLQEIERRLDTVEAILRDVSRRLDVIGAHEGMKG